MAWATRRPSSVRSGGIWMSVTTTSGRWSRACASRVVASPATATMSIPASVSTRTMPSRMRGSSSPTTTVRAVPATAGGYGRDTPRRDDQGRDDQGRDDQGRAVADRSEEHTSELQSRQYLVCSLLLEKKN